LTIRGAVLQELFHYGSKFGRKKFVGLVHDIYTAFAEVCDAFASEVKDAARCAYEHVD
jgi:hypothetical protein